MNEVEAQNRAKDLVRKLFMETVGGPPANEPMPSKVEMRAAGRRVNTSFGHALLAIALVPFMAGFSSALDANWRLIFSVFGGILLFVGAFFVDRSNKDDKALAGLK